MEINEVKEIIQKTLETQIYGVYNTIRNEQPHSALVGFAATPDLSKIIILTNRNTRKYINTQLHHKVTLFVSTTTNHPKDLDEAITISVIGTAEVGEKIPATLNMEYRSYFLEKNTYLKKLATSISDLIVITVDTFELTKNFQKSIVQTTSDMSTLKVRQLPGTAIVKGLARGKVLRVKSFSELKPEHENNVIVIDYITENDTFNSFSGKGLIIGSSNVPQQFEEEIKKSNIPTLKGIESLDLLTSNKDVTVNGSLGLIIFHEIKK